MIIQHFFEPTLEAHVIRICGQDALGNDLGNDVELLIRKPKAAMILNGIEALVALLRSVDDMRVTEPKGAINGTSWTGKAPVKSDGYIVVPNGKRD